MYHVTCNIIMDQSSGESSPWLLSMPCRTRENIPNPILIDLAKLKMPNLLAKSKCRKWVKATPYHTTCAWGYNINPKPDETVNCPKSHPLGRLTKPNPNHHSHPTPKNQKKDISIRPRQFRLNRNNILLALNLNHPIDLGSIPHQLNRTSVHHAHRRIAVLGKVIKEDVRDRETAGGLEDRIPIELS